MTPQENLKTMGTWPVFLTAISTILGAILFLRFGYAVAHVGLVSTLMIVFRGPPCDGAHRPRCGGNRHQPKGRRRRGLLHDFQVVRPQHWGRHWTRAVLVASDQRGLYVIAFTVACRDLLHWADVAHGVAIDPMWVNLGVMALLTVLMVGKGANLGVKALYIVVVLLFSALVLSFWAAVQETPT